MKGEAENKDCWSGLSNSKRGPAATRLLAIRFSLAVSLIAAAAICSPLAYITLKDEEMDKFEAYYGTVTDGSAGRLARRFNRLNTGIQELASIYSYNFPRAKEWPNVAWNGFIPTAELLGKSSMIDGMAFIPLIRPEQLASYEAFIPGYYATDPSFVPESYNFPLIPEGQVWSWNVSTSPPTPYHDVAGKTEHSKYEILAPGTQYTFSSFSGGGMSNFNLHSIPMYASAMDATMDCVAAHNYSYALTSCGSVTGLIPLPLLSPGVPAEDTEDMVALFVHPILPAQNQTELVGLAAGSLSWRMLLNDIFPAYVKPFDIVIQAGRETFTFTNEQGVAKFKGHGDMHDGKFDEYAVTSQLSCHTSAEVGAPEYTITFYPTKEYAAGFFTNQPVYVALGLLLVFLYCAALFLAYDLLVQRETGEHAAVLDTKRRFVRFISHEIRTPLNTVRLGMKLLEVELAKLVAVVLAAPTDGILEVVRKNLASWQHLADDITLNSETAVEVLNDLLNYDKIEMGTLRLNFTFVNICSLLSKAIATMKVQAEQKNIRLELAPGSEELISQGRTILIGDKQRIEQVVRSLISNALRFTPNEGIVTVSGQSAVCSYITKLRLLILAIACVLL
jgi:hypothetical protein